MLTIRKGGHRDLERYYGLMEIDFDSEELLGKLAIHRAISRGEQELLIVYDDESNLEVAYALCGIKSLYGYVLLKYMAVFPWYRGKGLGIQTMRLLNKRYADRQGIIAELTEFDDPEPDHLKKLFKFFSRFGRERLPHLRHDGARLCQAHRRQGGHHAGLSPRARRFLRPRPHAHGHEPDDRFKAGKEKRGVIANAAHRAAFAIDFLTRYLKTGKPPPSPPLRRAEDFPRSFPGLERSTAPIWPPRCAAGWGARSS